MKTLCFLIFLCLKPNMYRVQTKTHLIISMLKAYVVYSNLQCNYGQAISLSGAYTSTTLRRNVFKVMQLVQVNYSTKNSLHYYIFNFYNAMLKYVLQLTNRFLLTWLIKRLFKHSKGFVNIRAIYCLKFNVSSMLIKKEFS